MAEAEDLLIDAARHATVYAQRLWQRYQRPSEATATVTLADVAERLDLLLTASFGNRYRIRVAQPPAPPTLLGQWFRRHERPRQRLAIPATDGSSLWLPGDLQLSDAGQALELYRAMALQQACRAERGRAGLLERHLPVPVTDIYLLLEAQAADRAVLALFPGMASALNRLRQHALTARPGMGDFSTQCLPLEQYLRMILRTDCRAPLPDLPDEKTPQALLERAYALAAQLGLNGHPKRSVLFKDWWTGELRSAETVAVTAKNDADDALMGDEPPRSARMQRRPQVREARGDEDDESSPGAWMVQADEPHQHAEDPMGLNRPTDRDDDISADQYSEMVSDLSAARLVATPSRPREVLISDDSPEVASVLQTPAQGATAVAGIVYPEWDWRGRSYRIPGATVHVQSASHGSQHWVDTVLAEHQGMLDLIRRRFEMLQARRVWHRRQADGDDIDLDAYVDSFANFRAGLPFSDLLYQRRRKAHRHMAITLLIDVSGSTDSWIAAHRRVIDVEREALLLVAIALQSLGEPYSIEAFSGEGAAGVRVHQIKRFDEPFDNQVALRISALEPEHYTRAGAAIRHACAGLMGQLASHRLLLLLSDGKPSDKDEYEGQYGMEDTRQAVVEATLQGVSPFCLTIDRQASHYLPYVFGANRYALLPQPQALPVALLEWMRRLLSH